MADQCLIFSSRFFLRRPRESVTACTHLEARASA